MAETDWQEGKQIKDGRPDVDYVGAHIQMHLGHDDRWICKIRWGDTFAHLAFGKGSDCYGGAAEAIQAATEQALRNGCPIQWLPDGVAIA